MMQAVAAELSCSAALVLAAGLATDAQLARADAVAAILAFVVALKTCVIARASRALLRLCLTLPSTTAACCRSPRPRASRLCRRVPATSASGWKRPCAPSRTWTACWRRGPRTSGCTHLVRAAAPLGPVPGGKGLRLTRAGALSLQASSSALSPSACSDQRGSRTCWRPCTASAVRW